MANYYFVQDRISGQIKRQPLTREWVLSMNQKPNREFEILGSYDNDIARHITKKSPLSVIQELHKRGLLTEEMAKRHFPEEPEFEPEIEFDASQATTTKPAHFQDPVKEHADETPQNDLSKLKRPQLAKMAKEAGLKITSRMSKKDLITAINSNGQNT